MSVETISTEEVNQVINRYFEQSIRAAETISPAYAQLWRYLHEVFSSGGKRLRPKMTLLAYRVYGGDSPGIVAVAAAQELLHLSLLIHDDIIDRDYVRHGVANVAGRYQTSYASYVASDTERTHYAHSAALLGGDLMLSGGYQMIAESTLAAEEKAVAQQLLSRSVFDVAGGELLDTEAAFMPANEGNALLIARYKTASYSFVIPLLTGATLAGANQQQQNHLRRFAEALGIAFQLVDDLLGVFGDEAKTGKSTSNDIREKKHTYLVEQCLHLLEGEAHERFVQLFAKSVLTDDEVAEVKLLLESSGAKAQTSLTISRYAAEARDALGSLTIEDENRHVFEQLIAKVTSRNS